MDEIATRAIAAVVEVASRLGLGDVQPVVLRDASNLILHLTPHSVVARVQATCSLIRQPSIAWLQKDLDIATYLDGQGFPVVRPSSLVAPGPHLSSEAAGGDAGSVAMTFWEYVEHDRDQPATDAEAAAALHGLHGALRGYNGRLPLMGVLFDELPRWLLWLEKQRVLSGGDLLGLRQAQWELVHTLQTRRRERVQPLHGDAHRGNLLRTPRGLLWTDFEDACKGPVAWDVATLVSRRPQDAEAARAAYPDAPGWAELLPYVQAHALAGVVYRQVAAYRFAEQKVEADAELAKWHRAWDNRV